MKNLNIVLNVDLKYLKKKFVKIANVHFNMNKKYFNNSCYPCYLKTHEKIKCGECNKFYNKKIDSNYKTCFDCYKNTFILKPF